MKIKISLKSKKGNIIKRKCLKITRKKFTNFQKRVLKNEFNKDPHWDKDKIEQLASVLGRKPSTIRKWNYDKTT